ncbi:MAG: LysR family transcriptional regulator [Candidatus Omnitrophica bacterium]|nr:LysR family transcriptional regulator [Candidatus Omnitrophota bacterium]
MKVKSKIWLEKNGELVIGEGKSRLLKVINQTGSINKAAKKMGVSFRHAWGCLTAIEKRLGVKLIERSRGGRGGGGSILTPAAKRLIRKYDKLRDSVITFTDAAYKRISS